MAIANVTLNNSFEQWRGVTNQLVVAVNEFESNGNLMRLTCNTSSILVTPNVGRGYFIRIDPALTHDTSNTGLTIIPSMFSVNTVMTLAASNYVVTNAAFTQSNTDNIRLTSAYRVLNVAFTQSNTDNIRLSAAYVVLNSAFTQSNTDNIRLTAAFTLANTSNIRSIAAFTQSNTDNIRLTAAFQTVNAAFTQSNTDNIRLTAAFQTVNAAFTQSNTDNIRLSAAYVTTNAAYTSANNAHGRIDLLSGNSNTLIATFQNSYAVTNAAFGTANAAFTAANNVGPQIAPAYATANAAFNTVNAAFTQSNTDNVRLSAAYVVTNASFALSNTNNTRLSAAYVVTNAAFTQSNTDNVRLSAAYVVTNAAFTQSNTDNVRLTAAFTQSNNEVVRLSGAYVSLNSAFGVANAGFGIANVGYAAVNSAFAVINSAFGLTNTALQRSGGIMTGALTVQNDVSISGNLTISGMTTYANTQTLLIGDNIITLNNDIPATVAPTENAGIEVDRGNAAFTSIIWNEGTDKWTFTNNGSTYDNIAGVTTDIDPINTRLSAGYTVANAAFARANTGLTSVTGTAGRITSTGGLTPVIDLATGGAGAATYGGTGVASITLDAYGRVSAVAAPAAAYLNTASYVAYSAFTGVVSGSRFVSGYDSSAAGSFSCSNWFRSSGATGWFNDTYGGGIYMNDTTWVRVYNGKSFWASARIQSDTDMRAPIYYDSDESYYIDPNSTSVVSRINSNYLYSYNGTNPAAEFVGGWGSYGSVIQLRTDSNGSGSQDGPRIWYHKGGAKYWSAGMTPGTDHSYAIYEDGSNATWGTARLKIAPGGAVISTVQHQAPIYYDYDNTGYYVDAASTTNLNLLNVIGGVNAIFLNNGTSNYITWNSSGVAAPTFTTRSTGTKLVLFPAISASAADYAIGIDNNTLWQSVMTTAQQFRWYGGTTLAMTLSGAGQLTLVNSQIANLGSTTLNYLSTAATASEGQLIANFSGQNSAYLYNNGTSWGLHSGSGGGIIVYNRSGAYVSLGAPYTYVAGSVRSPIFYDNDNTNYYCDPTWQSRVNQLISDYTYSYGDIRAQNYLIAVGRVVVGEGQTSSYIEMRDTNNSTRFIHNNDGTIGFLGGDGAWKLRISDDGNIWGGLQQDWFSNQFRSAIFYDYNNTGYYIDPAGNSILYGSLTVSASNDSGGGIILSDDGDIVDLNNGFCNFRFSSGVTVFSANKGGSSVITLSNGGTGSASESWRAPYFSDTNNTSYYMDPAGWTVINDLYFNSGYGSSQKAYGTRIWCRFNNSTIYGSGGMSSITAGGSEVTMNFAVTMPDNNYAPFFSLGQYGTVGATTPYSSLFKEQSTTTVKIYIYSVVPTGSFCVIR